MSKIWILQVVSLRMILLVRPVTFDEGQSWNSRLEDREPSKNSGSVKKKGISSTIWISWWFDDGHELMVQYADYSILQNLKESQNRNRGEWVGLLESKVEAMNHVYTK